MKKLLCVLLAILLLVAIIPPTLAEDVDDNYVDRIREIRKYLLPLVTMAETVDEDLYTTDSVQSLQNARAAAEALLSTPMPDPNSNDVSALENAYVNLFNAYYTELTPADTFSVTVRYSDNQFARHEVYGNPAVDFHGAGLIEARNLEPGTTLQSFIDALGFDYTYRTIHAIINGVYIHLNYIDRTSNYYEDFSRIVLHPGDDIVLFTAIPETSLGASLGGDAAMLIQYINSLRLQRFDTESYAAEAAQTFVVKVEETSPALNKANGVYVPAEGLTIFVSEPQPEKGGLAATYPLTVDGENIVTDEDGEAALTLYGDGWVLIQAVDLREDQKGNYTYYVEDAPIMAGTYYSMGSSAGTWVQISTCTHPEEVKAELANTLRNAYESYDQQEFPPQQLEAFQNAYANAVAVMEETENIGIARSAQQAGINGMREAYQNAVTENEYNKSQFRFFLNKLPDDVSLITVGDLSIVNSLKSVYAQMTDYQKSFLTSDEIEKYEAIDAINDFPEIRYYDLTVNIVADNEQATAAIKNMVTWLTTDGEGRYRRGSYSGTPGGGSVLPLLYRPNTTDTLFRETAYVDGAVQPGKDLAMVCSVDYAAWLPVLYRDLGATYVGSLGDEYTKVEGDGWTILDTQEGGVVLVNSHICGNLQVLINGVAYEQKGIYFSGLKDPEVYVETSSYIEASDYKGKTGVNVFFENPFVRFSMPYNDLTITVEWGPVDTSTEVSAAIDALTAAYNGYVPDNYSSEQWAELTAIYHAGVAAIKAADDPNAEKDAYIASMAAVNANNPGTLLGSVTVTVSNNTCPTGPWYDETEPFVSETIDLYDTDSMMTVVLRALEKNEFTWEGSGGSDFGITYLSSISLGEDVLAEFTGGSGSGWMGMLNNWFVHQSFQSFNVHDGTLKNGDHVEVVYTCSLGQDVRSGLEGTTDTVMYNISMTNGILSPAFDGNTKEYVFILDNGADTTVLDFEPMWRCFQSRAYKGSYKPTSANYYSSGDTMYLEDGDVIHIGSGDPAWPSMSGNSGVSLHASVYKINVVVIMDAQQVQQLIDALTDIDYTNYKSRTASVRYARKKYEALADADQSEVDTVKLETTEQLIAEFAALDSFRAELSAIDVSSVDPDTAQRIMDTYLAMSAIQTINLSNDDIQKIEAIRATLEQVSILYGDIDGNNTVTARDAAMLYAYLRGAYSLSEEQLACADVDGNGTITARDAAMLYAYLRGTLTSFPAQAN